MQLFRSQDLLVRTNGLSGGNLVITFDCYVDQRTLDREAFGEQFLLHHHVPAIHVLSCDNDWYHHPEMPEALAAIRRAVAESGAARVLTYGSSMGGYGAIRFADAVGADAVLALSPQYSVDPVKAPFETRWAYDSRRIAYIPGREDRIDCNADVVIAYDPTTQDRDHVALIAAETPVRELHVRYGGHPAGTYLAEAGLLTPLVLSMIAGDLDVAAMQAHIQDQRRTTATYWGELARRQPEWRPRAAVHLARRAVALHPQSTLQRHILGERLCAIGEFDEAVELHRAIVEASAPYAIYLQAYSKALFGAGDVHGALEMSRQTIALAPNVAHYHRWMAHILLWHAKLPEALEAARRAHALDPENSDYRKAVAYLGSVIARQEEEEAEEEQA